MPSAAPIAACPGGASATGATNATAHSPFSTRSNSEVHSASGVTRSSGPVTGVAAITYSRAAPSQHAPHASATVRHTCATGRRVSVRAHTVTTARAMPIANQMKNRGTHRPSSGRGCGTNIATV
ncbi:hypothetical protein Acsp04_04760 [Actinomadura sp. NBRC 104425]|nr:hypothetical protein Acsp04_04760 [Actinomadura sp. NBRC 104425]